MFLDKKKIIQWGYYLLPDLQAVSQAVTLRPVTIPALRHLLLSMRAGIQISAPAQEAGHPVHAYSPRSEVSWDTRITGTHWHLAWLNEHEHHVEGEILLLENGLENLMMDKRCFLWSVRRQRCTPFTYNHTGRQSHTDTQDKLFFLKKDNTNRISSHHHVSRTESYRKHQLFWPRVPVKTVGISVT